MKTKDELAASIRRRAMMAAEPDHSTKLHRLADEAASIKCSGKPGITALTQY